MQNCAACKRQRNYNLITKHYGDIAEDVKAECRAVAAMFDANDDIRARVRFKNFCIYRRLGPDDRVKLADLVGLYQDSN